MKTKELTDEYTGRGKGGGAYDRYRAKRSRDAYPRNPTLPVGREVFKEIGRGREPASALIRPGRAAPSHTHRRDFSDHSVRSIRDDDADAPAKVRRNSTPWRL